MRRLWLIFAQACTICLALLFVVTTLKPEWISKAAPIGSVVMVQEQPAAVNPIPKDTEALTAWARQRGVASPILDAVRAVNAERPARVLALLGAKLQLAGARVAVLGLAFKPETDDLRESRSVDLARLLHAAGAEVRACDPVAAVEGARLLAGTATVTSDAESALAGADAAVLATAWPSLVALDPSRVRALMRRPLVLDARRALDPVAWAEHCEYLPIGRNA